MSTLLARAVRPAGPRRGGDLRTLGGRVLVVGLGVLVVLGCSGLLAGIAFQQYSETKWLLTLAGPAVVLMVVLTRRPLTWVAAAVVLAVPFMPVAVSVHGITVRAVTALLVVGVVVAFLSAGRSTAGAGAALAAPVNHVGRAALLVTVLLLPAAARGLDPALWLVQVGAVASVGYVLARACHLDPHAPRVVLAAFAASVALQGLLAVREFQTGRRFSFYGAATSYGTDDFFSYGAVVRPSGAFYDPISLGNVLALACPMLVALACSRGFTVLLRTWFALCGLAAAGGLVLTLSRMSWIGAAAGVVVVVLLSRGGERLRQVSLLVVGAVVVSVTAVALAGPSLLLRFNSIFDPTATGVSTADGDETRQQLWRASYEVFSAHPLTGVGSGNLHALLVERVGGAGLFGHAHSTYLQNLAEAGVLGGLAIAVLALGVVRELGSRLRGPSRGDVVARACAGAVVTLAVVWTTDYTIRYTAVLVSMAIPLILLMATRRRDPFPSAPASAR